MIVYILGLCVATVVWLIGTSEAIGEWKRAKGRGVIRASSAEEIQKKAKIARLWMLAVFLVPVYPFAVVAGFLGWVFVTLRELSKDLKNEDNDNSGDITK